MIRVAAVATAVTCHSNGTAGIVTSKSKSPDHASRISVSTASAAIALSELQRFSPLIAEDVFAVLTLEGSLNARDHPGGTAPAQVRAAIARARRELGD